MSVPSDHKPYSQRVSFIDSVNTSGWDAAVEKLSLEAVDAHAWWDWYERDVCVPWVIHESPPGISEVEASSGTAVDIDGLPLIVQDLDSVSFMGQVYALRGSGLYRFIEMTRSVRNLIVTRDGDPLPVLQGLSALQVHSNRDNTRTVAEQQDMLPACSFLSLTCGAIAGLTAHVLAELGFRTRPVSGLTSDEWNTYDNEHALFELLWPRHDKWVLADVDMGYLFRLDDVMLSAGELWECLQRGDEPELVPLARKIADPFYQAAAGFNWFLRFRTEWGTQEGRLAWYRRVLQNVGVWHDGRMIYVGNADRIAQYHGMNAVEVLPYAEWRERLYGR